MSDRIRQKRHWPSTTSSCCTSCLLLLAVTSTSDVLVNGIVPRRLQRKPTSSSSSSTTWHNWPPLQPRGGSVPSTLSPGDHQDPTTPPFLGLADEQQQLLETFRNEIREIVAECHEDMQTILHDVKDNVQRERQWRKDRKALLLAELSNDEDDAFAELPDGSEDLDGLIQLDVFSDLQETENLDSGAYNENDDEMLDDFVVGDTDEEDEISPAKVDNIIAGDEEEEMIDNLVFESAPESGEENAFVDLNADDADQELVESGSITVKAKALKKHKKNHVKTQGTTNIHPESVVNINFSAVEEVQSGVVADRDESSTSVDEDWQSRRSLSKKRERRKKHKAEASDDTPSVDDDRNDSVEAFARTKEPSKSVRRFDLIARPLIFAIMGLLAAMLIYSIFDLVILYLASDASVFNKDK